MRSKGENETKHVVDHETKIDIEAVRAANRGRRVNRLHVHVRFNLSSISHLATDGSREAAARGEEANRDLLLLTEGTVPMAIRGGTRMEDEIVHLLGAKETMVATAEVIVE